MLTPYVQQHFHSMLSTPLAHQYSESMSPFLEALVDVHVGPLAIAPPPTCHPFHRAFIPPSLDGVGRFKAPAASNRFLRLNCSPHTMRIDMKIIEWAQSKSPLSECHISSGHIDLPLINWGPSCWVLHICIFRIFGESIQSNGLAWGLRYVRDRHYRQDWDKLEGDRMWRWEWGAGAEIA